MGIAEQFLVTFMRHPPRIGVHRDDEMPAHVVDQRRLDLLTLVNDRFHWCVSPFSLRGQSLRAQAVSTLP